MFMGSKPVYGCWWWGSQFALSITGWSRDEPRFWFSQSSDQFIPGVFATSMCHFFCFMLWIMTRMMLGVLVFMWNHHFLKTIAVKYQDPQTGWPQIQQMTSPFRGQLIPSLRKQVNQPLSKSIWGLNSLISLHLVCKPMFLFLDKLMYPVLFNSFVEDLPLFTIIDPILTQYLYIYIYQFSWCLTHVFFNNNVLFMLFPLTNHIFSRLKTWTKSCHTLPLSFRNPWQKSRPSGVRATAAPRKRAQSNTKSCGQKWDHGFGRLQVFPWDRWKLGFKYKYYIYKDI